MLIGIRRVAIVVILLLGYIYFRAAGEAYALVGIGLISFAAVAQFAPAMFGGMYWKQGTRAGAVAGCWRLRRLAVHPVAAFVRQVRLDRQRLCRARAVGDWLH
jgi:Na+(H+)/acetate symporter ActP